MDVQDLFTGVLKKAVETGASDIHIAAGTAVKMRIKGQLTPFSMPPVTPQQVMAIALHILHHAGRITADKAGEAERNLKDEDCAYSAPGIGRFRVNICKQRGTAAIVLRAIAFNIPTLDELGAPKVLAEIAMEERGLILLTGATGSGKSSTLAAMVGMINATRPCKIVTIEDPIEFIHRDKVASILQREVGFDTNDFSDAMRAALRQDPDVILVGEMRDAKTVDIALKASETGHLVLSTVHTPDAAKTLNRLLGFFDASEQMMLRVRLADSLRAIVSQRLLPRADGKGRALAAEILRTTTSIRESIANPEKAHQIMDYIKIGGDQYGMQTFDQHLMKLHDSGEITMEVARAAATSPAEFERNLVYQ